MPMVMLRASPSIWNLPFIRNWLLSAVLLSLGRLPALADHSVTLGWDPSPDTNTVGYDVYYGGTSGVYTNSVFVGDVTTGTISGLTGGATYYFSATAVSSSGVQSIFSNEATCVIPLTATNGSTGGTNSSPSSLPPTLNPIANVNVYQNAGSQTVNLTGISAGTGGNATVNVYAISSDNGAIISTPTVYYTNVNSNGTLTFAPVANASGTTTVTVTVNNGGASNNLVTQQFTVTVLPNVVVSQPPTLDPITNLTIYGNSCLQTVNLTGITAGIGGNSTVNIYAVSSDNGTIISTPTVNYTNSNSTGTLTFTPVTNSSGTAIVTVTVNNGGATNNLASQQFTVTVLPTPTLNAITNVTIYQNSGTQTVALTGITPGTTNGNLTMTIWAYTSDPTILPAPTVNYTNPNRIGSLTFAPVPGALGTATVTVKANNGPVNFSQVFTVTVVPGQPPTLNAITDLSTLENAGVQTVNLTGISPGFGGNPTVNVSAVSSDNGTIISTPTVVYTNPNNTGTLTFAPVLNASGTAKVTVTVSNGGTTNNLVSQQFTVTVLPVPTLNALTNLTINQYAGTQTVALTGITPGTTNGNLTMTIWAYTSDPTIVPAPTVNYTNPNSTGSLTFAPVPGASGTVTVTVKANNGPVNFSQLFTVTVVPGQPPTLNAITDQTTLENAGVQTVNLTGISPGSGGSPTVNVSAVSGDNGKIISTPKVVYTNPNSAGTLTFAPVLNASGTATVTVTVNNGGTTNNLVSQQFTVTVLPVPTLNALTNLTINQYAGTQTVALTGITPGTTNENLTMTIWAYTSDPTIVPAPTVNYANPNSTGSLTFAPVPGALGTATVTVKANNGPVNLSQVFTVTVVPVPPPTLNALTNLTIFENAKPQTIALTGITSGPDNQKQVTVVSAVSSNPAIIPAPKVSYSSTNNFGTLTFAPATNALGAATITVAVTDSSVTNNTTTQTFTITVVIPPGGNHPPTLNAITNVSIIQGTPSQTVALSGITSGSPTEKQTLEITAISSNPTLIPTPTIRYTSPASTATLTLSPKASGIGAAIITVTVNDGGKSNNIVSQSFNVMVVSNRPPTLNPIANITVAKNAGMQTVALTGITSGSPSENQILTVSALSSNPRLIPNPTIQYTNPSACGWLNFKPLANVTGTATVTVTINDGSTKNNLYSQSFTIAVTTNLPAVPSAFSNVAAVPGTTGYFGFQVTGLPGGKYVIEATSDLVHWTPVQTNNAPFDFQEATTPGINQRFYRATFVP